VLASQNASISSRATLSAIFGAGTDPPSDTARHTDLARFKAIGASLIRSLIQLRPETSGAHHLKRAAQAADPDDLP